MHLGISAEGRATTKSYVLMNKRDFDRPNATPFLRPQSKMSNIFWQHEMKPSIAISKTIDITKSVEWLSRNFNLNIQTLLGFAAGQN